MKRYVLLLGVLLCCITLKAQSVNYTCRYWFDQNHAQAVTTYFSESNWQAELDVGSLSNGMHALFLQICDTSLVWDAPKSYLFYKALDNQINLTYHYWFDNDFTNRQSGNLGNGNLLLNVDELDDGMHLLHIVLKGEASSVCQNYMFYKVATQQEISDIIYHCWFDQDVTGLQNNMLGNGNILLDVAELENGMHTVNVALQRNKSLCSTASYMFLKVETIQPDSLDLSHLMYHCWFDQDFEHQQTDSLRDGHILLDVDGFANGLHTVNVMLESSAMSPPESYMFMKVAVQDSAAEVQYRCWFDNDYSTMQTGSVGTGIFELEMGDLSNGLHTVNIQLDNGTQSAPLCYLFYKRPVGGLIAKWEYWLNGEINNRYTSNLSPCEDTLSIITLLPVETQPIRSTCFHFQPNGEEPYINAKNEITLRFWDADYRFIDKSTFYVDENVSEPIVADTLERNTTVSIDAPRDNQIHWFKMEVGRGDYLSFKADKACTMQLFAPSGEEVYSASGPESILMNGFNVWENGTYYLAVHDVTGSGETVSVTYNWLNRYAVASYDVHLVGNGGCSTITFQGNGFNSLLDAYLVNWQNDTIRSLDIGHESNTTTTVSLNFYQENLGAYDAVFEFYEETIRINGALEVQEPVDILLTSTVSYPSQFLRNTPCIYTYTITNNGNMSAYVVPIYVYIASSTLDGISHLEINGLNLPTLDDYMNLDSLTIEEVEIIREWANEKGDDHYFNTNMSIENEMGDTVAVRSSFFFVNVAPFESKTIKIQITSATNVETWMTIPGEVIRPLALIPNRDFESWFCCLKDHTECLTSILASNFNWAALVTDAAAAVSLEYPPAAPLCWAVAADINFLSCLASFSSSYVSFFGGMICDYYMEGFWESIKLSAKRAGWSSFGTVLSCLPSYKDIKAVANALKTDQILNLGIEKLLLQIRKSIDIAIDGAAISTNSYCESVFKGKTPDCFSGDPQGGIINAVSSLDPNDIYGYLSESGSYYMRQEIQNVQYEIEFENDTTLATAAAHTIIVRDTLDATKFDLNSLAARSVTIGDKRLDLNGEQTFARTMDLRPEIYVIAQVEQDYDPTTGIIQWTIQSLDPMTMEPTDDPNQGVLPVNYFGDGVGFIDYSIDIKEAFADGTEISNRAGIIFDQEEQILTPTWTNIIDAVKPTSHIEEVTPVADSLNFQFVSSDNRSGVWYHTLYYRNDSTDMEWQVRKPQILGNEFMLPIDSLLTTEFLVMAVDSAGNREEKEMVAEYTYFSTVPATVTQTTALNEGWNWYSTYIEQEGVDGLTMLKNSLGTNGIRIQSKNDGALDQFEYNGTSNWYGSLNVLNNEQMYKVLTNAACNVAMSGYLTRMENHPITLNEGWNWIGFPNGQSLSLETAMSGFTPESDDIIKGRNASATFISYGDYTQWYGTLNALEPGQGYMYKSNSSSQKTLVFQSGRSWKATAPTTHEGTSFTSNTAAFADNMLVTAVIELGGRELRSEDYELAAFVDNECRGSVKLMYVEPFDRYVALLLAFGKATETMHFVLTDGTDVVWSDDNLSYVTDGTIGTLTEPITLHFGTLGLSDNGAEYVNVFPNPSHGVFNIKGKGIRRIEVIDGYGQVLRSEEVKNDNLQINLRDRAVGAYLLRVVTDRGVTTKKLVLVR